MTTLAPSPVRPVFPLSRRLGNVVRLHVANPFAIIVTPLLILAIIFAANWVVWALIRSALGGDQGAVEGFSEGLQYSGASFWIFVYMMVVAIQAMNLTFPLALGFGSTRRDFYLGAAISFVGLSALFTAVYTVMALLEWATGGWGLGGTMFTSPVFGFADTGFVLRTFHIFCAFVFFFFVGAAIATTYVRWKARGLLAFFAVFTVVLLGGAAALTYTDNWPAFGEFFLAIGFTGGYSLALGVAALAGIAGWLVLRRATPRSS
ncbi:MAG: hypothetical protein J0G30_08150 [Actinomycetales bacterium]|nr:hypothetical protein [Actinomycetales bacterium]